MYLSRFFLNDKNPAARSLIASPQQVHTTVERCFLNEAGQFPERNADNRVLWRLDVLNGKRYILVLSPNIPDFSPFFSFGPDGETGESRDYNPFLSKLRTGQRWRFKLRGNAVHSKSEGEGARGKIFAHVSIAHQREWLLRKSGISGFKLEEDYFDVTESDNLRFKRGGALSSIQLGIAVYEGELEITDKTVFAQSLTRGIGRAKAYGCGLLTLVGLS